jgi:hypothetical protein
MPILVLLLMKFMMVSNANVSTGVENSRHLKWLGSAEVTLIPRISLSVHGCGTNSCMHTGP